MAYNTGKLKTPPSSWKVLLEPEYSKKYTIVEDYFEVNIYIAALMAGVPPGELSTYSVVNKPEVRDILKKLRMNSGPFWNGFARMWKNAGKNLRQ